MTEAEIKFLEDKIAHLEKLLLDHPLGSLFTGNLYTSSDDGESTVPLEALVLQGFGNDDLTLNSVEIGRLFLAPDESIVVFRRLREQDNGNPAGFNVISDNDFVQDGEPVLVIAYQDIDGPHVHLDSLHLARVMLDPSAPARLCTIAFGLMACTAYRRGFKQITLFAGGNGPPPVDEEPGDLFGYFVWPKFGFDAPLIPADLNKEPRLGHCKSVLDVIDADAGWWEQHGRGREMSFDLGSESRSWKVLIDYLYSVLAEDNDE